MAARHPRAAAGIEQWLRAMHAGRWQNPGDLRQAFGDADPVKVRSGQTVWVFNIRRHEFRLIAAIHFDRARVFALRVMTHAEYDLNRWKEQL
jgi:mRNA interferase HigB